MYKVNFIAFDPVMFGSMLIHIYQCYNGT